MKRTTKSPLAEEVELVTWKKLGGGSFYMKNRIIKPGQIFKAALSDIPEGVRDVIVPVDPEQVTWAVEKGEMVEAVKMSYTVQSRGAGYYNVVDADGKVQNEKALRKDAAEALLEKLNAE